jgi:two-component system cell cycle response regulator DivK
MTRKVLIIEDDEGNRRILEMTIRGLNFAVAMAANGEEGLELAKRERPDLILLDVMMPKMSGLDTLREIRALEGIGEIPILVISAKAAEQDRQNAMAAGANEFITKPFRVKTIQDVIQKYLGT